MIKYQIENGIKNYDQLIIGKNTEERIKALNYVYKLIDQNPTKNAWDLWKIGKKESKKVLINKKSFSNYLTPFYVGFARMDNTKTYQNIDFPTLVIIGKEDVLVAPNQTKKELDKIGNPTIEFKELGALNHFMTKKGANIKTNEIYTIDLSFKEFLSDWINDLKI